MITDGREKCKNRVVKVRYNSKITLGKSNKSGKRERKKGKRKGTKTSSVGD